MENIFLEYLFNKGIFVGGERGEKAFETCYALANKFGIEITEGRELANLGMVRFAADMLGEYVPYAFYQGFPDSVRELSEAQLLFDQLLHYTEAYGFGYTDTPGRSVFERDFKRFAFAEDTEPKKFVILTEKAAFERLTLAIDDLLRGSRPLGYDQYETVSRFITVYGYKVKECGCKNTAIRLLVDRRDTTYMRFLALSDVVKVVDTINYEEYSNRDIKALNLKNRDRIFISKILDTVFQSGGCDVTECFEKKAIWQGLLHHIHYKPKCQKAEEFLLLMRGKGNRSVYSSFEKYMREGDISSAVSVLKKGKGAGDLLRHLNYIISRCKTEEDVEAVIAECDVNNTIILLQLIMQYGNYMGDGERTFKFSRYGLMKVHTETEEEIAARRSVLSVETVEKLLGIMKDKLRRHLSGKLGKVFISPEMKRMAIPLHENVAHSGYGTLSAGSRIPLERGKKIRAFTYWELVDDIDLSVIGISESGEQTEFSWRTMYRNNSDCIVYSGDQVSGYNGGSEYFDIDPIKFAEKYPDIKYLVFCNNVFSYTTFDKCICRAGYMLRDVMDSGEIFEPKTVKTSFKVNGDTTFSYLFGLNLKDNEFVWLNIDRDSDCHVSGASKLTFLIDYFKSVSILNLADLFEMLASEVVISPELADVVISDDTGLALKDDAVVIHSYDTEKITALLG